MTDMQSLNNAAYDSRSLNELKRQAAADPKGKALQVAKQVEGMFVQMMLKSMRDALPQDGALSNDQTRLYTSLPMKLDNSFIYSSSNSVPMQLEQIVRKAVPRLPVTPVNLPSDSSEFIAQLAQPAKLASQQSGIPHHLILAQAALESGWGQRQILTRDGKPSYNVFGIKASGDWKGETTDIMTTEYEAGEAKKVRASFRVYGSYLEALTDYVRLLSKNPRYAAVTSAPSAEQGARALQAAGYATDPKYAQKLVGMIQQFKNMGEKVVKAYGQDITDLF